MKSYKILIDKYKDQNKIAFVLGAGQSLYDAYMDYRWKDIHKYVVISVNSSIIIMPWKKGKPDDRYWISNDALCMRWTWFEDVIKAKCIKIVRNSWLKHKKKIKGFLIFKPRPTSEGVVRPGDRGLCFCSSVPSSIDLSLQMNNKLIFLLGVDQHNLGGHSHFWELLDRKYRPRQLQPAQGPYNQQKKVFPINNLAYKALAGFAEYKKARIYNCSLLSKVDVFEKISLDYMWKLIKKYEKKKIYNS